VSANDYVLAQGLRDTRGTFETWQRGRWSVLGGWAALSLAIACTLLGATWAVANLVTPDISRITLAGVTHPVDLSDYLHILLRNGAVLAFHATACVAGFIAGASMPIAAQTRTGFSRWVHMKAGEFAIAFVIGVTLFSLSIQALTLGFQASTLAYHLHISNGQLILSVLPQALIELTALFLPMLLVAALIEVFLWPQILISISPILS